MKLHKAIEILIASHSELIEMGIIEKDIVKIELHKVFKSNVQPAIWVRGLLHFTTDHSHILTEHLYLPIRNPTPDLYDRLVKYKESQTIDENT